MKSLLVDLQYFSPVILYRTLFEFTHIVFEQYESFQKMSFRNRCMIAGADGPILLSIPLGGGRDQRTLIRDLRIDYRQNWQRQHLKTINSCYNRSPWFEHYKEDLEVLFSERPTYLMDWNRRCFEWTLDALGLEIEIDLTQEYLKEYPDEKVLDWRNSITPKSVRPVSGDHIKYSQVFEERTGFIPNLSILDLIFCEGKNARKKILL